MYQNLSKWDLMKNSYDELEKWLSKENEAVEQVAPVEETRTNYEAAEELVITNKVPGETTSAVTIFLKTQKNKSNHQSLKQLC